MATRFPAIDKSERVLQTECEHERALIAACKAAAAILEAKGVEAGDREEPLPASAIELLKRLPRI